MYNIPGKKKTSKLTTTTKKTPLKLCVFLVSTAYRFFIGVAPAGRILFKNPYSSHVRDKCLLSLAGVYNLTGIAYCVCNVN